MIIEKIQPVQLFEAYLKIQFTDVDGASMRRSQWVVLNIVEYERLVEMKDDISHYLEVNEEISLNLVSYMFISIKPIQERHVLEICKT